MSVPIAERRAYRPKWRNLTQALIQAANRPETDPGKDLRFESLRAREWTTPTESKDEDWICYMLAYAATGWTRLGTARDRMLLASVIRSLAEKVGDILDASEAPPAPPEPSGPVRAFRADIDG